MMLIDPKVYNFKNLKGNDQLIIRGQYDLLELIKKEKEQLIEDSKDQLRINKFLYDAAIEELDELEENVNNHIIHSMATIIDNYDYYVKEQSTNDYYYGITGGKNE